MTDEEIQALHTQIETELDAQEADMRNTKRVWLGLWWAVVGEFGATFLFNTARVQDLLLFLAALWLILLFQQICHRRWMKKADQIDVRLKALSVALSDFSLMRYE